MDLSARILSEITVHSKYARYRKDLQRRETWAEICERNMLMHVKKFPLLREEIESVYRNFIVTKKVLPSMRSLQTAGKPIELAPHRMFNCSFLPVDDYRSFSETMFLLLGGTGVGYSVQRHHISRLPPINKPTKKRRYLIGDSIEGWADAVKALMSAYMLKKPKPVFDFSDIREKGTPLVTSGGKAPGPQPLKDCLHNIEKILNTAEENEQLTSIQVHDIMCFIADAVLAGGIRRAAMISLFDMDDEEMLTCKFGSWWEMNPQRGRANNSVVLDRSNISKKKFIELWKKIEMSGSGEPGFYFTSDINWGTNPCKPLDSLILTDKGYITFEQALSLDSLKVFTPDGRLVNASKPFKTDINQDVYRVELSNGSTLYGTSNHRHQLADGEWVEISKLSVGDYLKASYNNIFSSLEIENFDRYNKGLIAGWIFGDGWIFRRKDSKTHIELICALEKKSLM